MDGRHGARSADGPACEESGICVRGLNAGGWRVGGAAASGAASAGEAGPDTCPQ